MLRLLVQLENESCLNFFSMQNKECLIQTQHIMALFSNGVGRFRTLFRRHAVIKLRRDGIHFLFLTCLSDRLGSRNYVKQRLIGLIWLVLKKLISADWKKAARALLASGRRVHLPDIPWGDECPGSSLCLPLSASAQPKGSELHPDSRFLSVNCLLSPMWSHTPLLCQRGSPNCPAL